MSKTFLVMAGGTGGHVYPALAAAEALRQNGARVVWLGSAGGMEERIIGNTDIPMQLLSIGGLRGKGVMTLIKAPLNLLRALWQAYKVYRREHPDCVLGMGGFAAGPGGIVAMLTRTPLVIHEQNAIAGMTNRWLAKWAKTVLQAFPGAFTGKEIVGKDKVHTVGNPVRQELTTLASPKERGIGSRRPTVVVLGGSRGAQALNEIVPAAMAKIEEHDRPAVIHQAGAGKEESCRALYEQSGVDAQVFDFLHDMRDIYEKADLVICRAGALTLTELTAVGVGAILVPYPYAVDDHQTANARYLEQAGAAIIFQQAELTVDKLASSISQLLAQPERLLDMADKANQLAQPEATQSVVRYCLEACA
ncbi:undecaprenyldiphospho-muramoylpentapeptide beta-N-acetylglucosaminyltransferase [Hahella sp. CCB-MM4]|uniref:undecaprenyldiphospho-muramoylpentapeptide beta-N-acetylglucosaminyltransferase n=1 Tax=Hahella sp. (strain CCB-MM4) TaxID=1926491 RepID=UPI000B9BB312|nr:undecaprenyldiphospho-muramoylpentapeptide beta-N-acetylglucosaminyltransferase [Hahella sp. CCB-MM4]OZG71988.1 undecaprenyldiphospho-muramoylpentapeptide beta-N-acetylglucosaminyltransferase [Hahella sp. CCB-MM4]